MKKHECENYGSFEDWFIGTRDRYVAHYGGEHADGHHTSYSLSNADMHALFQRFGSEIEGTVNKAMGMKVWEVARNNEVMSVNELTRTLVRLATESLEYGEDY